MHLFSSINSSTQAPRVRSAGQHLVVVEVAVDGEAMAPDLPLVARRAPLAPPQDAGVALRPEQLGGGLAVL